MKARRTVVLSPEEIGEAIKIFIRAKYHEKIEKTYYLTSIESNNNEPKSYSCIYDELL